MIDFNFKDLKHNQSDTKRNESLIKTDHTFDTLEVVKEEDDVNGDVTEVKEENVVEEVKESKPEAKSIVKDEDVPPLIKDENVPTLIKDEKVAPLLLSDSIIEGDPLLKVSVTRKSFEEKEAILVEEIKTAIGQSPSSSQPAIGSPIKDKENIKPESSLTPETEKDDVKGAVVTPLIVETTKVVDTSETEAEEISAPPPLPTNNAHLIALRDSLKPSMLPVKPVNGAPSTEPESQKPSIETVSPTIKAAPATASPLSKNDFTSEELNKEMEKQKLALEREIDSKKGLEAQIQAIVAKSKAQEEALKFKNESLEQLQTDFLKTNNDLTSARSEKLKLETALAKVEKELAETSETNAKAFIEKSDEVSALKDKLAEFASIIGQKNKEIASLEKQLEETKRASMHTVLENVQQYDKIEDDLVKMVETEILRMQDTIAEQREYNSQLQLEVDSEYAFWKRKLSSDSGD